nr:ATP-binding protein [Moraxella osloensis]
MSLEEIDYSASRQLKRPDISLLFDYDWINNKQCLIITGMTGTGKTWLGCAFANHACRLEVKDRIVHRSHLIELKGESLRKNRTAKR